MNEFGSNVERHRRELLVHCYRMLGSLPDAEDAVQECYLRAFLHFDTYHGPAIKPWLFAILRNVCNVEHARRSKLRLRGTESNPETLEETGPLWQEIRDTPEFLAVAHRVREALRAGHTYGD